MVTRSRKSWHANITTLPLPLFHVSITSFCSQTILLLTDSFSNWTLQTVSFEELSKPEARRWNKRVVTQIADFDLFYSTLCIEGNNKWLKVPLFRIFCCCSLPGIFKSFYSRENYTCLELLIPFLPPSSTTTTPTRWEMSVMREPNYWTFDVMWILYLWWLFFVKGWDDERKDDSKYDWWRKKRNWMKMTIELKVWTRGGQKGWVIERAKVD